MDPMKVYIKDLRARLRGSCLRLHKRKKNEYILAIFIDTKKVCSLFTIDTTNGKFKMSYGRQCNIVNTIDIANPTSLDDFEKIVADRLTRLEQICSKAKEKLKS